MPDRVLNIWIVAGEPRTGLWCDTCLTSARYEVDWYSFVGGHLPTAPTGTIRHCARCDDDA
jgi:hypothetical protein